MKPDAQSKSSRILRSLVLVAAIVAHEAKYLLISSPSEAAVYAAKLPSADDFLRGSRSLEAHRLPVGAAAQGGILGKPGGLAVDSFRGMLYIADPGNSQVVAMNIFARRSGGVSVDRPQILVSGVDVHWVAADPYGNLYYSDKSGNAVWWMSPQAIDDALNPSFADLAATHDSTVLSNSSASNSVNSGSGGPPEVMTIHNPVQLYSAAGNVAVNTPHGVAADSADVFWVNGASGTQSGVVMQGKSELRSGNASALVLELAHNTDAAYGICLSHTHIFFTASTGELYAVQTVGGTVLEVSTAIQQPRGCAHDGDGTLFVADRQDGKVYAIASGGLASGVARDVNAVLDVPDAFGLAVFAGSSLRLASCPCLWIVCMLLSSSLM